MSFEARYGGTCSACGERIHIGDTATYVDDSIVHVDCDAVAVPEKTPEICGTCWLTKPCGCDD